MVEAIGTLGDVMVTRADQTRRADKEYRKRIAKEKGREAVCAMCGCTFVTVDPKRVTCSTTCSLDYSQARTGERARAKANKYTKEMVQDELELIRMIQHHLAMCDFKIQRSVARNLAAHIMMYYGDRLK